MTHRTVGNHGRRLSRMILHTIICKIHSSRLTDLVCFLRQNPHHMYSNTTQKRTHSTTEATQTQGLVPSSDGKKPKMQHSSLMKNTGRTQSAPASPATTTAMQSRWLALQRRRWPFDETLGNCLEVLLDWSCVDGITQSV